MKEVFSAISDRFKTPYYGYVCLAFFALNWQAIYLLILGEGKPSTKLSAFDTQTSLYSLLVCPLLIGLVISLLNPWVKVLFAWVEKVPRSRYSDMMSDEEHSKAIYQNKLKQQRNRAEKLDEERLINRAVMDEFVKDLDDGELKEQLVSKLDGLRQRSDYVENNLAEKYRTYDFDAYESALLKELSVKGASTLRFQDNEILIGSAPLRLERRNYAKEFTKFKEAALSLTAKNIFEKEHYKNTFEYSLTGFGWDVLDNMYGS